MRTLITLLLVAHTLAFGTNPLRPTAPGPSAPIVMPDDARAALANAVDALPYLKGFPVDKLKSEASGIYYARDVELLGNKMTIAVYTPKGKTRLDVAVMLGDISLGSLLSGLGETPLDVLTLRNPVVIYSPGVRDTTVGEKMSLADLPADVAARVKLSADALYLRKGLNLTSQLDPTGSLGEAVDLLKNVGIDLKDLVVQSSVGKGKSILLMRRGVWSNPFQLKNSSITNASLYILKKATGKTLAGWGNAKVGNSDVFLFAERATENRVPVGDAYGLNAPSVTLKVIVDFIQAIPFQPEFPTAGLSDLPLDKVKIKNPAYAGPVEGGVIPDVSKFIVFAATTPAVKTPDGQTKGPRLVAHGDASLFNYDLASLALDASLKGVTASAAVPSFELAEVKMKSAKFFLGPKTKDNPSSYAMSISGGIDAFGLVNQSVDMFISADQYSFSTSFRLKGIGDATLNAQTGHNYGLPWDVSLDVSGGVAGKIYDAGMDAYAEIKKGLPKAIKVVEPEEIASSLRLHELASKETWNDVGESAGQVFSNPSGTVTAVSKAGYTRMKQIAKEAGKKSEDLLRTLENKSVKVASAIGGLLGIRSSSSNSTTRAAFTRRTVLNSQLSVDEMVWGIDIVPNYVYGRHTSPMEGETVEPGFPSSNAVDGKTTTVFISEMMVRPKWELDLQTEWKHLTAIVIKVPENDTIGLQGAIVAVAQHHRGQGWFENPPSPEIHFYPITVKAAYYVIVPSNAVPGYVECRENMWRYAYHYIQEGKDEWMDKFQSEQQRSFYYMLPIRDIAIFKPGKGRVALAEVSSFRAEDLLLHPVFDFNIIR